MSWHGAKFQYYSLDGNNLLILEKYYMDHIIDNENKQEKLAVFALLEAVIVGMKKNLSKFSKVTLLFDTAWYYKDTLLILQTRFGLTIKNNKNQINVFLCWGHDCVTPSKFVITLKSNGGLDNFSMELVRLERPKNFMYWERLEALDLKLKKSSNGLMSFFPL